MNAEQYYDERAAVERSIIKKMTSLIVLLKKTNNPMEVQQARSDIRTLIRATEILLGATAGVLIQRVALMRSEAISAESKKREMDIRQGSSEGGGKSLKISRAEYGNFSRAELKKLQALGYQIDIIENEAESGTVSASATLRPAFARQMEQGQAPRPRSIHIYAENEAEAGTSRLWRPSDRWKQINSTNIPKMKGR